jgi:hypothetical protein
VLVVLLESLSRRLSDERFGRRGMLDDLGLAALPHRIAPGAMRSVYDDTRRTGDSEGCDNGEGDADRCRKSSSSCEQTESSRAGGNDLLRCRKKAGGGGADCIGFVSDFGSAYMVVDPINSGQSKPH